MAVDTIKLVTVDTPFGKQIDSFYISYSVVFIFPAGVSDLARHFLVMKNISMIRRIKRTDSDRLAILTGATVVHDPVDVTERDGGTKASEFYAEPIGDE
ncbi:Cpn60 TCP1 domain containing protein [Trichuris trichiura]|uniref:Cpn60 TCP1 domain containing protein n=1 Tax=Trichuris trichiura TaxID=36087 RepID=A0A077ZLD0_TRITR|nr:Cpn60 TCP1 domain containing protein [Trichuris trichiura]